MESEPTKIPGAVLHVVAPAPYGGAESVLRTLTRAQRSAGYEVHVAAVVQPGEEHGHPFVTAMQEERIDVTPIAVHARAYLRERREFRTLCERLCPAIVHAHGPRAVVIDGSIAHQTGARLIATVHGLTGGELRNRFYERLMMIALRRYDAVVAVSRPIANALKVRGVHTDRITVIPNALDHTILFYSRRDARHRLQLDEDAFVIGWIGRFVNEKGGDVLVEALRYMDEPGWKAVLIGDGPKWADTRALVNANGFAESISLPGVIAAAGRLLKAFDIFVLSSRTEGTPITLLEAMVAEVPIVATTVGGVPDVLGPNEALLVPPDDPRLLARAINLVRSDRIGAARRVITSKASVYERFSVEPWCLSYTRVYRPKGSGRETR